jgi:GR25 family glycosyltransferase involved in LPS biosynthesis
MPDLPIPPEPVEAHKTTLEIDQLLDILAQVPPASPFYTKAARLLDRHLAPGPKVPEATPVGLRKTLTIGMATYDDYDGVYFSVQAIRLYHPEVTDQTEILVIDNHPEGPCSGALKNLEGWISGYRYIPVNTFQGTTVRDLIFRESNAEFVLCMDSHVLFAPGSLQQLIEYFETHPATRDLLQGPLLADNQTKIGTHFNPIWSSGMLGQWAKDDRGADPNSPPFEIPMQGLGVFACRRDAWLGFNPRMKGFGGEEGYIHEKFRRAGAKALCLPFLRWMHRFARPQGTIYALNWDDRVRNYLIAFDELGLDATPVAKHFEEHLGEEPARRMVEAARREIASPFHFFDAIYCINLDRRTDRWQSVTRRFEKLGIAAKVRRFAATETPYSHHIGCALSHRAIIADAARQGLDNVLVFEDDVLFSSNAEAELRRSIDELKRRDWSILFLGGHRWGRTFEKAPGCQFLDLPRGLTCTHAVAYNHTVYDRILADIPGTPSEVALWLRTKAGIDQYFAVFDGERLLTSPVIASQATLIAQETRRFEVDPVPDAR